MGDAKGIRVEPISAGDANRVVRALHYSGKVAQNSQVHFGVFLGGRCGGAIQLGPSLDRRKMLGLVEGTKWHGMLEINRIAFADWLPRNSESRALGYVMRWLRSQASHVEWLITFADATQCGDGAIYRAAGFWLTGIKRNKQILRLASGGLVARKTLDNPNHTAADGSFGSRKAIEAGATPLPGFQLRYICPLAPDVRQRLTVPILPYSAIADAGAGMYLGQPCVRGDTGDTPGSQPGEGGSIPTRTLHIVTGAD